MMQRVLVVVLIVALAATGAFAQAKSGGIARQLAMGGAQVGSNIVVNPYIFTDPVWLLVNPAYQADYGNYVWFNAGGGTIKGDSRDVLGNQFGGAHFAIAKEFTLGAILSYDPTVTNTLWTPLSSFVGASLSRPPIETFEVLAAFDMGNLKIGAGIMYGWNSAKTTNSPPAPANSSESEVSASAFGIRGGLLFDLGSGSAVDASFGLHMDKVGAKNTVGGTGNGTGTAEATNSATEIQVTARVGLKISKAFTFVPYGAFRTYSYEPKIDAVLTGQTKPTNSLKSSFTGISAGAGGEYKLKQFYLAGGVGFITRSTKTETNPGTTNAKTSTTTESSMALPVFNLGAEYWVLDWMAVRAGYFRAMGSETTKNEPGSGGSFETSSSGGTSAVVIGDYGFVPDNDNSLITLGMGLKFGAFALDAMVSENALRRGLGLIGSSDNINTFGYLNLSYSFE
jgi:hypothetical protein